MWPDLEAGSSSLEQLFVLVTGDNSFAKVNGAIDH